MHSNLINLNLNSRNGFDLLLRFEILNGLKMNIFFKKKI